MSSTVAFCSTSALALHQNAAQSCTCSSSRSPWVHRAEVARPARPPPGAEWRAAKLHGATTRMQSGGKYSVPINAPSGVLLAVSSVMAIASVGCVFELAGGHPQYGQSLTAGILVVSLPSFIGLFYAAIRKGQAEAEEE